MKTKGHRYLLVYAFIRVLPQVFESGLGDVAHPDHGLVLLVRQRVEYREVWFDSRTPVLVVGEKSCQIVTNTVRARTCVGHNMLNCFPARTVYV